MRYVNFDYDDGYGEHLRLTVPASSKDEAEHIMRALDYRGASWRVSSEDITGSIIHRAWRTFDDISIVVVCGKNKPAVMCLSHPKYDITLFDTVNYIDIGGEDIDEQLFRFTIDPDRTPIVTDISASFQNTQRINDSTRGLWGIRAKLDTTEFGFFEVEYVIAVAEEADAMALRLAL